MIEVKKIIDKYAKSVLVDRLIKAKTLDERDDLKGQILACEDFGSIYAVYEKKDIIKLRDYLEILDVYADNLQLFINVTEPRQERVLLSKMATMKKIKANILKYINESGTTQGVYSKETGETEGQTKDKGKV